MIARRVLDRGGIVVADRTHKDYAFAPGVSNGCAQGVGIYPRAEAHVDDLHVLVGSPMDRLRKREQVCLAVIIECANRHDHGARCNGRNDSGAERSMAICRIHRQQIEWLQDAAEFLQKAGLGLLQKTGFGLFQKTGFRLMQRDGITCAPGGDKVMAAGQMAGESRMRSVDAGIDVGHDHSSARRVRLRFIGFDEPP